MVGCDRLWVYRSIGGGNCVVLPNDMSSKNNNDLRAIGETLTRISRLLHEHASKLEIAVEGRYASEGADPRVRLLSDSLHISKVADLELGRISKDMERLAQAVPNRSNGSTSSMRPVASSAAGGSFEREREMLTTSISNLKQERNELETLYEIARTLNSTLEFDEVLRLVMDRVIEFVNAERGFLMLVDPATGQPRFTIARDKLAHTIPESEFAIAQISRNTVLRVIRSREPLLTGDAQTDDVFKAQESILAYGIRSIMCAPLIVRDHCIGAVYVDSRMNARLFHPKHRDLLLAFCNQAAIAIDNARLFADLNKAIKQVSEDKQYMDNIFGSIANGVITTDSSGIITTFNSAAALILCLQPDLVTGRHFRAAFQTIPQVGLIELLQDAHVQHEHGTLVTRSIECSISGRKHDEKVNLNCYVSALRDMQGAHIGMALVIDDRTELKRSEAKVKEIRRIFERYVHPSVVNQLIQDPLALKLGGETKEISVISADIRGYTRLSEGMPPEKMVNLLNNYLDIMVKELWSEEGTLTAFWGDELMAIFNAPLQQRTHALQAVRAAWKMRMAILEYQRSLPTELHVSFGFGVNTGLATVGNIGSQTRMQNYTAIGDVVNVASRLQSNATDNNIWLNESTYMQVYRHVQVGQAFPLSVKNKSAPLTVRRLEGLL